MDGTIPRARLAEVLGRIAEFEREFGLAVANVFNARDNNLHPLILYDANAAGQLAQAAFMAYSPPTSSTGLKSCRGARGARWMPANCWPQ